MALKNDNSGYSAAGRRFLFGTNVAVMTVLAVLVLVGINWLGYLKNSRWDLTGGVTGYRVSERTKRIVDQAPADQTIRLTSVYASQDPEKTRKQYFSKVQDLCEELRQYRKGIEVEHIISGNDQAALRDRVQAKFADAAGSYREIVDLAKEVWTDLANELTPQRQQLVVLATGDTWLGGFSTLANIAAVLQKDLKNLDETRQEIDDLIHGQGIPRYAEANERIKTVNLELKQHLEQIQKWTEEMDKLAKMLGDDQAEFVTTTRANLQAMEAMLLSLRQSAGDPDDPNVPADPKPLLQQFARNALQLGQWLTEESARVSSFIDAYPAIRQHPKWQIQRGMFVMELSAILSSSAEDLSTNGRRLRDIIAQDNVPLDQMQNVVRQCRKIAVQIGQNLDQWRTGMTAILDEGAKIDEQSKAFLAAASSGEMLGKAMDRLNEVSTKVSELPELKLDEIAERLQQDNIIVVEYGSKVRVVTFDEAWPIADPIARQMGGSSEDGPPARVFDGDSAIGNALLAMQRDKPVAQVVLVTFEEQVPPQMRQFQRPVTGPMPVQALQAMRTQLEAMQFKVDEWNLAEEGAKDKKPATQEGVPAVYIFLPPPIAPPPMFNQQQPQKKFTAEDAKIAREILSQENARGIFLANWTPSFSFGPPAEYGWGSILRDDWGIDVQMPFRVIRGEVDRKQPGHYFIDVVQWRYMQLSHFSEQPIGYPLRARRMLMNDVCPVVKADTKPDAVELTEVLEVPGSATDIWGEKDIQRIVQVLQSGTGNSSFTRGGDALTPPFSVILAGENKDTSSKIVVMGNGLSLRDDYLQQRVMRFSGKGTRLVTDPPPMENTDLLVNALYWLADCPDLIAAGPAEVPVVAAIEGTTSLWVIVIGWAVAALVLGGIVMTVRRK